MKKKLYSLCFTTIIVLLSSHTSICIGQNLPQIGDLIITEFMSNPESVSDTKGEWFELLNISSDTLLLSGLCIKDDGSNEIYLESDFSIILLPDSYFLLARSGQINENGGLNPDYVYSNFSLGNSEDEIIICLPDGTILDEIKYTADWDIKKGVSLELNPEYMDSGFNEKSKWKLASNPYGDGDLGSPGIENTATTGLSNHVFIDKLGVYPNPCYGKLNIELNLTQKVPLDISMVNLIGQEIVIFESTDTDLLYLEIDTEWFEKGLWLIRLNIGSRTEIRKVMIF